MAYDERLARFRQAHLNPFNKAPEQPERPGEGTPAPGPDPGVGRAAAAPGHRGVQAGDPGAARALGAAEGRGGAAHPPPPQAAGAEGPQRGRAQHPGGPGASLLQGEEQEREADVRQVQHHHLGPHPDLVHLHRLLLPVPQQVPAAGEQGLRAGQGQPSGRVPAQHLPRERAGQPGLPLRRVPCPRLPPGGAQRGPAVRLHRPLLLQRLPLERPGRRARPRHPQLGLRAPQGVALQHAVPGADGVAARAEAAGDQPAALQLRGGAGGDPEAAPGHPAHEALLHHLQGGDGGAAAAAAAGPAALCGERRDVLAAGPDRHRGRAPELLPDGDPHPLRQAHQAGLRALPGERLRLRALQGGRRALPLRQPHVRLHRLLRRLPQGLLLRQLHHLPQVRPAEPAQAVPLPALRHRGGTLMGGPAPRPPPDPPRGPGTERGSPRLRAAAGTLGGDQGGAGTR
ncbi:differentially expressed in FDCP 8 homolog isoform X4 [Ciconia boyciana]|uniref:differentially expressed in FDCP 8 homolog isoform X4 n=1 Tax=Ciconia boyciana TaxID=52775 RepID=UPI003B9DD6EC